MTKRRMFEILHEEGVSTPEFMHLVSAYSQMSAKERSMIQAANDQGDRDTVARIWVKALRKIAR
jgi:hypothetical protein